MLRSMRGFDAYTSAAPHLTRKTRTGAYISIVGVVLALSLGCVELVDFLTPARTKTMAVDDALAQATTFASAAGYKIGGVLSMNVNDFNSPSPVSYEDAALGAPRMASAPIATPVSSGTISVSSAVDIVYFLVKEDAEN